MRVFLTGATGWVGTAVARELRGAGHSVLGLARNDEGAAKLAAAGVEAHRGDLTDPASFAAGAQASDGVIHCAFIHDFSRYIENADIERRAVEAMLAALAGTGKPFIATSGVAMVAPDRLATEDDPPPAFGRGATETLVLQAADQGVRTAVVRLAPSVHGIGDRGFTPTLIAIARAKGVAAYIGAGGNVWSAVHRSDAARLYLAVLERGGAGVRYHAIGDPGVPTRQIAEAIGRSLNVPVASKPPEEAQAHFGFLGAFFGTNMGATSVKSQNELGWHPTGPSLLDDIADPAYASGGAKYA